MTAAFFTLGFLTVGWAAIVVVLALLDDQGAKIMAALKGQSLLAAEPIAIKPVAIRVSPRLAARVQPVWASIEWRAAA